MNLLELARKVKMDRKEILELEKKLAEVEKDIKKCLGSEEDLEAFISEKIGLEKKLHFKKTKFQYLKDDFLEKGNDNSETNNYHEYSNQEMKPFNLERSKMETEVNELQSKYIIEIRETKEKYNAEVRKLLEATTIQEIQNELREYGVFKHELLPIEIYELEIMRMAFNKREYTH